MNWERATFRELWPLFLVAVMALALMLMALLVQVAQAEPTAKGQQTLTPPVLTGFVGPDFLKWRVTRTQNVAGFFVYYRPIDSTEPYSSFQRFMLPAASRGVARLVLYEVLGDTPVSPKFTQQALCFRVTAFDAGYEESEYSNEHCGWEGLGRVLPKVSATRTEPILPSPSTVTPLLPSPSTVRP